MDIYAEDEELADLHIDSFSWEINSSRERDLGRNVFVFVDGAVY